MCDSGRYNGCGNRGRVRRERRHATDAAAEASGRVRWDGGVTKREVKRGDEGGIERGGVKDNAPPLLPS